MDKALSASEQKLTAILKYAPLGIAEIDEQGIILQLNVLGEQYLHPIQEYYQLPPNEFFPLLELMAPSILQKIKNYTEPVGSILLSEIYAFGLPAQKRQSFNYIVTKIQAGCIIVSFENITEKQERDAVMQQMATDKALEQGKFEMASGVLHDIGNAVVGFGAYLNRMKGWMDQDNTGMLQQLVQFFEMEKMAIDRAIGAEKAGAVIALLQGVCMSREEERKSISHAVKEQHQIISHIQEILNIQRQYMAGQELRERKPVGLYSLVNDSLSMLQDMLTARKIQVLVEVPVGLPVVNGDRTRLMQVLLNVIKNSMEALQGRPDDRQVAIRAYQLPEKLVLEVADNGVGFEPAMAAGFFERGFTTKVSGSGLGLYNCRAIIESHSGTIAIGSEGPGRGAITTIQFLNNERYE